MRRFSALGNPFGQLPSAAHPVGEEAAAAVESRISGEPQEGRRYFDAPTYRFDFSLAVGGVAATRQVVDLYYKRFHGVPATVHLKDGTRLPLGGLSRRRAIDLVERRQRGGGTAHVDIGETKDSAVRAGAAAFVSQAVARVDRAQLVSPASRASAVVFVQPPLPRVLNVAVASSDRRVLGGSETLRPASEYLVRVDIGVRSEESVLVDPVPFRAEELEPSSAEGWWFDVVVSSGDLDVQGDLHRLFLPFDGPSWACGCAGQEHVCAAEQRRPHLYVPVKTRGTGAGTLRCTVYDRNNAVQSARLEVVVADGSSRDGAIRGIVDFSLSDDVSRSEGFAPRRVNVLTNAAAGGTHTIVVKDDSRAIVVDLTETSTVEILRGLRGQLVRITLGADGRTSQYDADNAKAAGHYIEDLESLAHLGAAFWQKVVPRGDDQERLRGLLARRATIQIARATSVVFPWALVYDIPHLLADPWKPCPLLADWETERAALESYPDACPYEREHRLNILCPYGFWGFKHLIEQPPTVSRGLLRTRIPVARGARAAVIRSLDLDSDLTEAHLTDLRVCFADRFELTDCDSRDDLLEAIRKPVLPIVYFYCHGRIAVLADTSLEAPYLEIGSREILGAGDLGAWAAAGEWNRQNWVEAPPLVFINGCRTAALSPEDVVSFAEAFSGMDAAGVVGTEIPVAQPVASEIARRFYAYFTGTQPLPVGAALQRARLDLLAKGNVSGLAYTPFCSMDLELEEVRAA
jgi:hypothetical protein